MGCGKDWGGCQASGNGDALQPFRMLQATNRHVGGMGMQPEPKAHCLPNPWKCQKEVNLPEQPTVRAMTLPRCHAVPAQWAPRMCSHSEGREGTSCGFERKDAMESAGFARGDSRSHGISMHPRWLAATVDLHPNVHDLLLFARKLSDMSAPTKLTSSAGCSQHMKQGEPLITRPTTREMCVKKRNGDCIPTRTRNFLKARCRYSNKVFALTIANFSIVPDACQYDAQPRYTATQRRTSSLVPLVHLCCLRLEFTFKYGSCRVGRRAFGKRRVSRRMALKCVHQICTLPHRVAIHAHTIKTGKVAHPPRQPRSFGRGEGREVRVFLRVLRAICRV